MGELQEILIRKRKELNLSLREAGNLIKSQLSMWDCCPFMFKIARYDMVC